MRIDMVRGNKTADSYIDTMSKSFSENELNHMRSQPTEELKMRMFYRFWCLKESVLKATGEGISEKLSLLDFNINVDDKYEKGEIVTSTELLSKRKKEDQWSFEESFVDDTHVAAVCREVSYLTMNKPKIKLKLINKFF